MFCRYCGNEIKENDKFCGKCGTKTDNNLANENTIANASENKTNAKEPIKIKFTYIVVGIIIILVLVSVYIAYINGSKSVLNQASTVVKDNKDKNAILSELETKENNLNLPIYINKTYISKSSDLTYYITFTSTTQFKYVAKDNHGIIDDIVMDGLYEIEGNTIQTVSSFKGTSFRDTYTIVDKDTIKTTGSNVTTYKVSNN